MEIYLDDTWDDGRSDLSLVHGFGARSLESEEMETEQGPFLFV